jgi:23S rRNA (cytosine1962-C5)-methyltransferase
MTAIQLKEGREKPVLRRHPWIFSGAVRRVIGDPGPGETVDVETHDGAWLARAAYSPHSQIRARIWTWSPDEYVDEAFLRRRVQRAIASRQNLQSDPGVTAYREIYAESDGLPGLICDRYADLRVVQFLSMGVEFWREAILDALEDVEPSRALYERSDVEVRRLEGLQPRSGALRGEMPDNPLTIEEHGFRYLVDYEAGQKTGFYLDLRDSRARLRRWIESGVVLNAFAYTGAFSIVALAQGVRKVVSVDSSTASLELAKKNIALNGFQEERCQWVAEDVFSELRACRDRGDVFDTVILDPPKFAATRGQVDRAARAYKDINLLGMKLLRPGGTLATFSCSSAIGPELFQKIVADAALDAEVEARVMEWFSQPSDHPVALNYPEGRYLKGMVVQVAA